MSQIEKVSISSLRRQLQDWKDKNPEDTEIPLEIQQQAKFHGSKHGYRKLAELLKVDFEKLYSKIQLKKEKVRKKNKAVTFTKVECAVPPKDCTTECLIEVSKGAVSVKIFHLDSKVVELIRQMME